jgi:hydroxymethylpyrimidine pyrophosphatase-like HAD family hydrolase
MEAINMVRFERMSNRSFSASVTGLIKSGPEQIAHFKKLTANAIVRVLETNDVTHINRMVEAALACGRYRTFARVVPGLIPFAYDKSERVFSGKRQNGKYNKLMKDSEITEGAKVFEDLLVEYFEKEDTFSQSTPSSSWDLEQAMLRLVKTATKKGKSVTQIEEALRVAEKEVVAA